MSQQISYKTKTQLFLETFLEKHSIEDWNKRIQDKLGERYKFVIINRYGNNILSLKQIGEELGISSGRVGQMEYKALMRIITNIVKTNGTKLGESK